MVTIEEFEQLRKQAKVDQFKKTLLSSIFIDNNTSLNYYNRVNIDNVDELISEFHEINTYSVTIKPKTNTQKVFSYIERASGYVTIGSFYLLIGYTLGELMHNDIPIVRHTTKVLIGGYLTTAIARRFARPSIQNMEQ